MSQSIQQASRRTMMTASLGLAAAAVAAPFAAALRRGGAQVVANGRIPVQAILASLEAEADETTV